MGAEQNFDWRRLTASALEWWDAAGVDVLADECPRDWLAPAPAPTAPSTKAEPVARSAAMPTTADAFAAWRVGPDAPEAAWPGRRLGAEGDPGAPLWVFTDLPEREDLAEGRLLGGAQGSLFDRMLAAIGRTRADILLVPLATARPPAGRIGREVEARLGEVARHHLSLGRPTRALLMGEAASRCLLAMNCQDARGSLHRINHSSGQDGVESATMIVASLHPRFLLDRPMAKADAWRDLRLVGDGL